MLETRDTETRLQYGLADLNHIGAAINRIRPRDNASINATLYLIVESAVKAVPDASAAIYVYDQDRRAFDLTPRVSARGSSSLVPCDPIPSLPYLADIGICAIEQRMCVLSYEQYPQEKRDPAMYPVEAQARAEALGCFPLIVADEPVGALYVYLRQDRQLSQLELLMLENFSNQAAMVIHQACQLVSVQRDLARKENELSRLRRAGLLISSRLRLDETLEAILQMAMEVTDAQYGIFRLVDRGKWALVTRAIAGEHLARPQVETLPIDGTSVMGWVAEHRQAVCIPDLQAEPWVNIYRPLDAELEMCSELAVPLIGASGRLEGVLNLESPAVGAFDKEDSHLLQALATQAVIAIQEVRLLDALQEVAQLLLAQPLQQALTRLVELACDLLDAAASAIWTLQGDELILQVASAGFQRGEHLPLHGSLTGQAIVNRSSVAVDDVRTDSRFNRPDLASTQQWTQALIVPLLTSDESEPVGAFSVYRVGSSPGRFTDSEWDEKVLTCLAHYATLAVQNATRQKTLREVQERHAVAETFAAVGDIAANVLHHVNNKVGTIPVRIQGIQDKCRSALLADLYLSTNLAEIEHSASEAMKAVRENLSHLHPIQLAPVDVAACVTAATRAASLPDGIHVHVQDLDTLPAVVTGQRSLSLVFTNLLENSADAMQGDGIVTFQGRAEDGWVEVSVSDNGPGIDPELHDRLFDFSFSGRESAQPDRLGFGLWWVKTLMVRLGGSVDVESDGQHGTTFHLRLPRFKEAS